MTDQRPLIFIGSSAEGLNIAKAVQANLDHGAECVIWSQGIFGPSGGALETLTAEVDKYDFAILILSPDDKVTSRNETSNAPRDNVLLELGMFIIGLGRERTFMIVDRTSRTKLPSDLAGITTAMFQPPERGNIRAAVGAACTDIRTRYKHSALAIDARYMSAEVGSVTIVELEFVYLSPISESMTSRRIT